MQIFFSGENIRGGSHRGRGKGLWGLELGGLTFIHDLIIMERGRRHPLGQVILSLRGKRIIIIFFLDQGRRHPPGAVFLSPRVN